MKVKKEYLFIITLILIGFLLRLFITNCYYWDELVYLQHSEILNGKVNNYNEFDLRPPMLSILIAGLYYFWHNPLVANFLISLLSALSILIVYLIGEEIFDKKTAIFAAILLTFWPIHIYLSKQLLVHTPAMFFGLLALLFIKKAERSGKNTIFFLSGFFIAISILTRFTYLVLIPLFLINIIMFWKKYDLKKLFSGICGFIIPILPYLIWAKITYGDFFYTFKMARLITDWSSGQPTFFYLINLPAFLSLIGIIGIVLWIISKIADKDVSRQETFMILWFIVPMTYLSLMYHKELRFFTITLVPLLFLSSLGFRYLYNKIKNKKLFLTIFLIIISFNLIIFSYVPEMYPRICNSDAQKVSAWVMNMTDSDDIIYAQEEFSALAYYTDRKIILAPFNKTRFLDLNNNYMNQSGYYLYFEKQNRTEAHPSIEEILKDPRFELIVKLKNIEEIYVYRYEINLTN